MKTNLWESVLLDYTLSDEKKGILGLNRDLLFEDLQERERKILKLRFDELGNVCQTLQTIALMYRLGQERIRQIVARATVRLRHPRTLMKIKNLFQTTLNHKQP